MSKRKVRDKRVPEETGSRRPQGKRTRKANWYRSNAPFMTTDSFSDSEFAFCERVTEVVAEQIPRCERDVVAFSSDSSFI